MRVLVCALVAGCGFAPNAGLVASKCPQHGNLGAFYCDGFEDGLSPDYLLSQGRAVVALDDARAYRGGHSLHIHSDAYDGGNSNYIDGEISIDASGPVQFGAAEALRVFVYLPPVFDSVQGTVGLGALGDISILDVNRVPSLVTQVGNQLLTSGRWLCLEVRTEPADLGSTQTLLLDGEVVAQFSMDNMPNVTGFALKLTRTAQPSPPLDVWFDELVLDDRPIGCDR